MLESLFNKITGLKITNVDIWVIGILNQLFILKLDFQKNKLVGAKPRY